MPNYIKKVKLPNENEARIVKDPNAAIGASTTPTVSDAIVTFSGTDPKQLKSSNVAIEKNTNFSDTSDAKIPTSKSIANNVADKAKLTNYTAGAGTSFQTIDPTTDKVTDAIEKVQNNALFNKTNILSLSDANGQKNLLYLPDGTYTDNGATFTISSGAVSVTKTTSGTSAITPCTLTLPAGTYQRSGMSIDPDNGFQVRLYNGATRITDNPFTLSAETTLTVQIYALYTSSSGTLTPMVCTKSQFDISPTYQPYALGNQILTPAMIQKVDEGAKQKAPVSLANAKANTSTQGTWNNDVYTRNGISFTLNSDMSVTVNGTATADSFFALTPDITMTEDCILTGCPTGGGSNKYEVQFSSFNNNRYDYGGSVKPVIQAGLTGKLLVGVRSGATVSNLKFYPMICTLAAWNVSKKYVPYRPNWDLVYDALKIEVLTGSDIFTPNTNYTVISDGAIYKQGRHIFGVLIVSKSDGNFTSVETPIGQMKTAYRPVSMFLGNNTTFNVSQWGVAGIGYCYIPPSSSSVTNVSVKTRADDTQQYNVVMIKLDYCTK